MSEEIYIATDVVEDVDPQWLKGNILTFLLSENPNFNEKWISRIVGVTSPETVKSALEQVSYYENSERLKFLKSLVQAA